MSKEKNNNILIADDEKSNLDTLFAVLSPEYNIFLADNGIKTLELAEKILPDLILLDIVMPEIDGYEVLETLKKSPKAKNIPVIFLTGLEGKENEIKALALDAVDFIQKPFNSRLVRLRVRTHIKIINQIKAIKKYTNNMELTLSKVEAIVNNYKGIIWSVDIDRIITSFSGQFLKVIGIEPEFIVGKKISGALKKFGSTEMLQKIEKTFSDGPQEWITEISGRMLQSHSMPMYNNDGNLIGIVGSSNDVTELIRLSKALAATEEKDRFFARMSHEMRTPLNAVIGLSELIIEQGGLSQETRENMEKVCNAGSSLLYMVNDILDISKIESGKFQLVPVEYDTAGMIIDSITQSMMHKADKPIEFILNIEENLPQSLFGDEIRIKQILNNLLSNAFKYTREGSVEFNIKYNHKEDNGILDIFIKDTGIGISQENLKDIFNDYSQHDLSANRKIQGTGLGMPITKMLLDMMEGSISIESEYGKGSIFYVRIPQKPVTNETIGPDTVSSIKSFHYSGRRRHSSRSTRITLPYAHVLVVDDVELNLDVARGLMKPYMMHVDCVTNGKAAVDAIRDEKVKYNAVFMDHMMPGMDGVEAVRIIREEIGTEYAKTVPIIAFTANALSGNEDMFLSNGFQAFMTKPIESSRLDAYIKKWVRNEEQEKKLEQERGIITIEGQSYLNLRSGKERRSGADRRSGIDRRMFEERIQGMNMRKGLERFGGNRITYVEILRSFTKNTNVLLNTMKEVNEDTLKDYAINVHGVKSSCRGIGAEEAGNTAEALEMAAKAGDLDFVKAKNPDFIKTVFKLITDIEAMLKKGTTQKVKPKKDKPYKEALDALIAACDSYRIEDVEAAINEIEVFEYTDDDGLVSWLRINVDQMNYPEIAEKLSQ